MRKGFFTLAAANPSMLLIAAMVMFGCKEHSSEPWTSGGLVVQGIKIPAGSVIQVDDYPLFVMDFDGDYGLADILSARGEIGSD